LLGYSGFTLELLIDDGQKWKITTIMREPVAKPPITISPTTTLETSEVASELFSS
jgi:hypothetical protein